MGVEVLDVALFGEKLDCVKLFVSLVNRIEWKTVLENKKCKWVSLEILEMKKLMKSNLIKIMKKFECHFITCTLYNVHPFYHAFNFSIEEESFQCYT